MTDTPGAGETPKAIGTPNPTHIEPPLTPLTPGGAVKLTGGVMTEARSTRDYRLMNQDGVVAEPTSPSGSQPATVEVQPVAIGNPLAEAPVVAKTAEDTADAAARRATADQIMADQRDAGYRPTIAKGPIVAARPSIFKQIGNSIMRLLSPQKPRTPQTA